MKTPPLSRLAALCLCAILALAGCGKKTDEKTSGKPIPGAPISVTQAILKPVEEIQESVGQIESDTAPMVSAEVAGRIIHTKADTGDAVKAGQVLAEMDAQDQNIDLQAAGAEVSRAKALLLNQQLTHERNVKLHQQGFISQSALDNSSAQLVADREQLNAARARLDASKRGVGKTTVSAPVAGYIDQRRVSAGDYVKVGDPLFRIATGKALTIRLPFPEGSAMRLKAGQTVRLATPSAPEQKVSATISEIRPMVGTTNRALEVVVRLPNPGNWTPGSSINGVVVLASRAQALTVPEQSVVLRPAGEVVYVIKGGKTEQRVVRTGVHQHGYVEIISGIAAGEQVAVDGAGFLTDKTPVTVQGAKK